MRIRPAPFASCDACVAERQVGDRGSRHAQRRVVRAVVVARFVVDRRWRWRRGVGLEVDERERELEAADAVGDRVMDLLEQRGAPVVEPLDERELPQRTGPVERLLGERAAEVEQRALAAVARKRDAADVRIEVERRVVGERGGTMRSGAPTR